jgi:GT2 family glycosyltransferase
MVINFNGGERVLNTLAALKSQRHPLSRILVVDNGSGDGSVRRIREGFPEVEILELGENIGLPRARNAGLRHLDTELVLMADADVYVAEDCIELLLAAWEEHRPTVVCPRIRLFPEKHQVQCDGAAPHFVGTMTLRHAYQAFEDLDREPAEVGGAIGACYLVDRPRVLTAGGFDEIYFFYFEDLEFSLRLRALGHRFVCEPRAEVFHDRGQGTPGLSFRGAGSYPRRRAYLGMRHRLLTMFIHFRARTLLVLAPALFIYELGTVAMAIPRGWVGPWARAWCWILGNLGTIGKRRDRMQRDRVLRDRELLSGGPLPLAPGFLRSRLARVLPALLSRGLDGYWRVARHLID